MPQKQADSYTIEITELQRNILLEALIEKRLDIKRYMSDFEARDEPGPMDSCCAGHMLRYERHKERLFSLNAQKCAVEATIDLLKVDGEPD